MRPARPPPPSPPAATAVRLSPGSRARRTISRAAPISRRKDALPPAMAKLELRPVSVAFAFAPIMRCGATRGWRFACSSSTSAATSPSRCICTRSSTARRARFSTIRPCSSWDKSGHRSLGDAGSRGICRLSRAVRDQLEGRRRRVPGRQLFSRGGRRYAAVRLVGARARGRYRVSAPRGISALHLLLVRAAGEGLRDH